MSWSETGFSENSDAKGLAFGPDPALPKIKISVNLIKRLKQSGLSVEVSAEKESMLDLIKDRHLLLRLLNLCVTWLIITLGYYGLSLTSVSLSGDPYLNFFLSALVEIPGKEVSNLLSP